MDNVLTRKRKKVKNNNKEKMAREFYECFPSLMALEGTEEAKASEVLNAITATALNKQQLYVSSYINAAIKAAKQFGISPLVLLAQGAVESGWGTSTLAQRFNNFFGITAAGKPNQYWGGQYYTSKSSGLKFRVYPTTEAGFADFARLITSKYKEAANVSKDISLYAHKIAQSPYISEKNGDNRNNYEKLINSAAKTILTYVQKKYPDIVIT